VLPSSPEKREDIVVNCALAHDGAALSTTLSLQLLQSPLLCLLFSLATLTCATALWTDSRIPFLLFSTSVISPSIPTLLLPSCHDGPLFLFCTLALTSSIAVIAVIAGTPHFGHPPAFALSAI
jgi:hypothetical protein